MQIFKSLWKNFIRDPEILRRREALKKIPIFEGLKPHQLTRVLAKLYHRNYNEGEIIFKEGDIGRALFVIESGRVALYKKDKKGRLHELAILGEGEFFGEMALLEEMPRSAAAVAKDNASIFFLYKSSLDDFVGEHPAIGASILNALAKLISQRLRSLSAQMTNGSSPPSP